MNAEEKALSVFRQPPRCLNCAQTICYAVDREDMVEELKNSARGNAPGGLCGALYAATQLAPEHAEKLLADFTAARGANTCAALKEHRSPCPENVLTALRLLLNTRSD